MEDKMLKACKELLKYKGRIRNEMCIKMCDECIFSFKNNKRKVCTSLTKEETTEIAQNYIKEHEKTVNTIEKIEEKPKYKVGDKVRVKSLDPDKYHESLIDYVGEILTINKIFNNNSYYVNENVWIWDEDMLEPVEENKTTTDSTNGIAIEKITKELKSKEHKYNIIEEVSDRDNYKEVIREDGVRFTSIEELEKQKEKAIKEAIKTIEEDFEECLAVWNV